MRDGAVGQQPVPDPLWAGSHPKAATAQMNSPNTSIQYRACCLAQSAVLGQEPCHVLVAWLGCWASRAVGSGNQ